MRRSLVAGMSWISACLLFCGTAVASNALGGDSECDAVPDNLVVDCGFESGTLNYWIPIFDPTETGVSPDSAHTGNYGLSSHGPRVGLGYLIQNLKTTPGATYNLTFWLRSSGPRNIFTVSWDGAFIAIYPDVPASDFVQYSFDLPPATGDLTELKFGFSAPDQFFDFDDVEVVATSL